MNNAKAELREIGILLSDQWLEPSRVKREQTALRRSATARFRRCRCLSFGARMATQGRNGRDENPETDLCGGRIRGGPELGCSGRPCRPVAGGTLGGGGRLPRRG